MTDRVDDLMAKWQTELPEALVASTEFGKRVMVLATALDEATRATVTEFGLTGADFGVLAALRRNGKPYRLKANELSSSLLLSSGGTSNVVNRLVTRGLVEREADHADGRSTYVRLTPSGVSLAEDVTLANTKSHEKVLAAIPADLLERATLAMRDVFGYLDQ
ncbi:MarR family transcriptional regulator [Lentzea sp. NPDC005914]|uniref:MarR family winged helix-turn-helix transcriptional regulator n=1 Tax=Lentzea sp. NPDC005914 TaxID=3154572 RepID=UPI0033D747B1